MTTEDLKTAERRAVAMDGARRAPRSTPSRLMVAAAAVMAAAGAPFLWVATLFSGPHGSGPLDTVLLAAIPSTLLVGALAAASRSYGVVAFAACFGQAVASLFLGYYVAMGLDGHSDAAARFSPAPLFAPVVLYAIAALIGPLIAKIRKRES